ncbi:MAG: hypothetical protein EPN72_06250 [Nevskiaceae bacterium]|nr:MAG: hypothetical protein EPN63_02945 [Nevskiaceae bacterium]TBR73729.1 MAG: hypothetical protein EPN72_06250 [Nevskiaceae bacterium]
MLIRRAELGFGARVADVRIETGCVTEVGARLAHRQGEAELDAGGAALLPALRDHHLHLYALAAARASVRCGQPDVAGAETLEAVLRRADGTLPSGEWLRGTAFHESVLAASGIEDFRAWLDAVLPARPVRIQHRGGRLWWLNTAALRRLGVHPAAVDTPLERSGRDFTGRLYDADGWLRQRVGSVRPSLAVVSRELWRWGVTAVTDASHANGRADYAAFAAAQTRGELLQDVRVMGGAELDAVKDAVNGSAHLWRGERKFHLHAQALPDFDLLCAQIRTAHAAGRGAAFHCVERGELIFALAALDASGVRDGDRIEHAGVAPPELVAQVATLGVTVVTQPGFIAERGDVYRREVTADDQPWLYPVRRFLAAGVPLALSSDAPYADPNPWRTAAAAVARQTPAGTVLNPEERLTPEYAVARLMAPLAAPGVEVPRVAAGMAADLCLLPMPWRAACRNLAHIVPVAVWRRGLGPVASPACAALG